MPKSWNSISETTVSGFGGIVPYASLEEAVTHNYWRTVEAIAWYESGRAVGHRDSHSHSEWLGGHIVFCDEIGLVIPLWKVAEVCRAQLDLARLSCRRKQHPHTFRLDPVPGTGAFNKRRWHGRTGKAYATFQERSAVEALGLHDDAIDYKIGIRGKRGLRALPDARDELPEGRQSKNWKRFRRTRWKSAGLARL